jgi:hypothetical protein
VLQAEDAGVGILRTALNEVGGSLRNGNAKRLAAEDEEIAAMVEVGVDFFPRIDGEGRAVRENEQVRRCESVRRFECGEIQEGRSYFFECCVD